MIPLEILAYETTPLGILCLRRRELLCHPGTMVTEVTLNHEFLMSSYLTESERALSNVGVRMALESLDPNVVAKDSMLKSDSETDGLRVLVGGLGLGYTAAEALKFEQVASVEVIEFLPQVIGWTQQGQIPLAEQLNNDPRLTVTQDDVYRRLTGPEDRPLDLILIDVDHSPEDVLGNQSQGFYTLPGLQQTSQHLSTGGVLGIWSYAADTPLLDKMKQVFDDVQIETVTVMNDLINEEQTDWLFFGRKCN